MAGFVAANMILPGPKIKESTYYMSYTWDNFTTTNKTIKLEAELFVNSRNASYNYGGTTVELKSGAAAGFGVTNFTLPTLLIPGSDAYLVYR